MKALIALLSATLLLSSSIDVAQAFSAGKGFGKSSPSNKSFIGADRFTAICPAAPETISKFDSTLINDDDDDGSKSDNDTWVAVYRSKNNLPSVFVRDSFFDAMAVATTAQDGDSQTLVSSTTQEGVGVISGNLQGEKPVAVARLTASKDGEKSIIDSMRCTLKKENTNPDCDGGSEHCEAIGVCIDELVISYLQNLLEEENNAVGTDTLHFDGGIRFRGTLFSGKLLEARGFREATQLSADMHSHESDFDGALTNYAERSTSTDISKSPGARDRSLKIVSLLSKLDRNEDTKGEVEEEDDEEDSDYDPWASVKRYL
ncbi:hypothetical protein ACHAWT_010033 [Skeletonema menzelii]